MYLPVYEKAPTVTVRREPSAPLCGNLCVVWAFYLKRGSDIKSIKGYCDANCFPNRFRLIIYNNDTESKTKLNSNLNPAIVRLEVLIK